MGEFFGCSTVGFAGESVEKCAVYGAVEEGGNVGDEDDDEGTTEFSGIERVGEVLSRGYGAVVGAGEAGEDGEGGSGFGTADDGQGNFGGGVDRDFCFGGGGGRGFETGELSLGEEGEKGKQIHLFSVMPMI